MLGMSVWLNDGVVEGTVEEDGLCDGLCDASRLGPSDGP